MVCEACFDTSYWLCLNCLRAVGPPGGPIAQAWPMPKWFVVGLALVLLGSMMLAISFLLSGQQGVLLIFPFLVVVGGPSPVLSYALLVLAVALIALMGFLALWTIRLVQRT